MESTAISIQTHERVPIYAVRWGAVFASLAVGLSVHLLLMLLGVASGLTALNVAEPGGPGARSITVAAGVWNTVSMLISAFIGGMVAGRATGLRRLTDGMIHGAIAWGATTLVLVALTTGTFGNALMRTFSAVAPTAITQTDASPRAMADVARQVATGDREQAIAQVQQQANVDRDQATRVVDWMLTMRGAPEQADPANVAQAERAVDVASATSWWLFGAILLSLIASIAGGALGIRSSMRRQRV
jgi:hypothetical protein